MKAIDMLMDSSKTFPLIITLRRGEYIQGQSDGLTPSSLFSLRLTFELSKSESLRDVSVTRISDTFPTVFCRLGCPRKVSYF